VAGVSTLGAVGNVRITGGTAGQVLSSNGAGGLSFTTISSSSIANGTSNVTIAAANGNVTVGVGGNANIATLTSTGANITGTLGVSGITNLASNLNVTGTSNLGPVGNVVITGGTTGQVLTTNGSGVLSWGGAQPGIIEYVAVSRLGTEQTGVTSGTDLVFNTRDAFSGSVGTNYNTTTGVFTLTVGNTYELLGMPSFNAFSDNTVGYIEYQWCHAGNNAPITSASAQSGIAQPNNNNTNESNSDLAYCIYTAAAGANTVKLRVTATNASGAGSATLRNAYTKATVKQLGTNSLASNVSLGGGAASTSTTTGGVVVSGGLGVSGNAYIGANLNVAGTLDVSGLTTFTGGVIANNGATVYTANATVTSSKFGTIIQTVPTGTALTLTLPDPTAAANAGGELTVWMNCSGAKTITLTTPAGAFYGPSGTNGTTSMSFTGFEDFSGLVKLACDGFNWIVFAIPTSNNVFDMDKKSGRLIERAVGTAVALGNLVVRVALTGNYTPEFSAQSGSLTLIGVLRMTKQGVISVTEKWTGGGGINTPLTVTAGTFTAWDPNFDLDSYGDMYEAFVTEPATGYSWRITILPVSTTNDTLNIVVERLA
jgi:hypothetical protein